MNPSFRLIDRGWDTELGDAVALGCAELRVVSPFIKLRAAQRLIAEKPAARIRVITRFHPGEMLAGVNDTAALRALLDAGAEIRGVRGLHAKVYVFGDERAIVTSANLTEAALRRNHEFGFVTSEKPIVRRCTDYFEQLWNRAGANLDLTRLEGWEAKIKAAALAGGRPSNGNGLSDDGTDAGSDFPGVTNSIVPITSSQAFVKFFGQGHDREPWNMAVLDEVVSSGSHWACTYPRRRRPRAVQDGDVMFMGRLVANPHDTVIYGRAIALQHVEGRDDAAPDDIVERDWKARWPAYIRVHSAEFVAGTLQNGVKLSELMDRFGPDAFASTQRNSRAKNDENTDPRLSLMQKPHVQLTPESFGWLEERLQKAFEAHGKLSAEELGKLDWPSFEPAHLEAYRAWSVRAEGRKPNTAAEYAYFLKRCATHYREVIDKTTVPNEAAADSMIERVRRIVSGQGRTENGTFNERDLTQNLTPALRAYGRFIASGGHLNPSFAATA